MPELPDVEVSRQYLDSTSLHQPIDKVVSLDGNMLWKISPAKFRAALKGNQLEETARHGKYLFAKFNHIGFLVFHFGMSGTLKYFKDSSKTPAHTRMLIRFKNDYHLAYVSVRKLGRLFIAEDTKTFIGKQRLGPDALAIDFGTFRSIFGNRRGSVKTALMNPKAIAGLGNIYADEILFQAGIRPARECTELRTEEWQQVFRTMRTVLKAVIKRQAKPDRFPSSYLTRHRSVGEKCPRCGKQLKRLKIGGRTTYYCINDQN